MSTYAFKNFFENVNLWFADKNLYFWKNATLRLCNMCQSTFIYDWKGDTSIQEILLLPECMCETITDEWLQTKPSINCANFCESMRHSIYEFGRGFAIKFSTRYDESFTATLAKLQKWENRYLVIVNKFEYNHKLYNWSNYSIVKFQQLFMFALVTDHYSSVIKSFKSKQQLQHVGLTQSIAMLGIVLDLEQKCRVQVTNNNEVVSFADLIVVKNKIPSAQIISKMFESMNLKQQNQVIDILINVITLEDLDKDNNDFGKMDLFNRFADVLFCAADMLQLIIQHFDKTQLSKIINDKFFEKLSRFVVVSYENPSQLYCDFFSRIFVIVMKSMMHDEPVLRMDKLKYVDIILKTNIIKNLLDQTVNISINKNIVYKQYRFSLVSCIANIGRMIAILRNRNMIDKTAIYLMKHTQFPKILLQSIKYLCGIYNDNKIDCKFLPFRNSMKNVEKDDTNTDLLLIFDIARAFWVMSKVNDNHQKSQLNHICAKIDHDAITLQTISNIIINCKLRSDYENITTDPRINDLKSLVDDNKTVTSQRMLIMSTHADNFLGACWDLLSWRRSCLDLKYSLSNYGIEWYNTKIGYFGLLNYVSMILNISLDSVFLMPIVIHQCGNDTECRRLIRTSMIKFASKIEKQGIVSDAQYWNKIVLISLGVYSFECINLPITIDDRKTELNQNRGIINKISKYMNNFVINNIEPCLNHEILSSKLGSSIKNGLFFILKLCYAIQGNEKKCKYYCQKCSNVHHAWDREIQKILVTTQRMKQRNTNTAKLKASKQCIDCITQIIQELRQNQERLFGHHTTNYNSKNANIAMRNQFENWIKCVLVCETRNDTLFIKWKNVNLMKKCALCGKNKNQLKKCKQCRKVVYCSKQCQKQDWLSHRVSCSVPFVCKR